MSYSGYAPDEIWTADRLKAAVRFRHFKQTVVVVDELRLACGMDAQRTIDHFVISADTRYGCGTNAYEVKISRSDFLRDLKQPLKHRGFRLIADQFWYVAPPGVIKPDEVPDWAGLLEPTTGMGHERPAGMFEGKVNWQFDMLKTVVPAPLRSKEPPSWPLVVSLLRKKPIVIDGDEA